jgi:hypothetical protein
MIQGVSFDVQPRFSPSGRFIAYSSDAGGCDNIWVLDTTSNIKYPVSTELYHFVSNPWWLNENQIIAVKVRLFLLVDMLVPRQPLTPIYSL